MGVGCDVADGRTWDSVGVWGIDGIGGMDGLGRCVDLEDWTIRSAEFEIAGVAALDERMDLASMAKTLHTASILLRLSLRFVINHGSDTAENDCFDGRVRG